MNNGKERKSIAFYCIGNKITPSTRFRVLQYLPFFEREGIRVKVFTLPCFGGSKIAEWLEIFLQGLVRRWQLRHVHEFDGIIIQKGLTPWRARGLAKTFLAAGKPFILDIDDAVFLKVYSVQFPALLRCLQDAQEPLKLMRTAAHIIAGNSYLAQNAASHNPACTVIPTVIDTGKYQPGPSHSNSRLVIGWSGSTGTNIYVNEILPILEALAEKHAFDFHVMSSSLRGIRFGEKKKYGFRFLKWSEEAEVESLRTFDIGVMPLADDAWSRGKCGSKALLYMAMGIPPVCSPVGVNTEIIRDGENGFLASSPAQWIEKIRLLLENSELRRKMGQEARRTVEEKYSVQSQFPVLKRTLERVCYG